ncbi:hypothetical protein D9619_005903 [Psilocybe cf. subviscida]|uniref:Mid2 domain-containing protein n=1 Tax=Psilocybe cf. subviscida TaxID=2480587 RepID=A0A8H5BWL3_9AGAR|nr:hypothetical protein D9619_005903 [Psilocybe cf. subviscida]
MLWLFPTLFTLSTLRAVSAQSSASCLPFYSWTFNSHKKSPCEVASSLLAVCNNGPVPVDGLPTDSHYVGPTLQNANACQCNTVVYSLMSACGACQGRTYLSWSVWSANCPMVSINSYPEPIPAGVAVPGWAYLDVKATDNFDQSTAKDNANITESTAIPVQPSTTSSLAHSTVPASLTSALPSSATISPTAAAATSQTSSPSNPNILGGSVVGGLFGLGLIAGLALYIIRRRKQKAKRGLQLPSPSLSQEAPWDNSGHGPYMTQVPTSQQHAAPSIGSSTSPAGFNLGSSVSGSLLSVPANQSHV